jgi:DNA polymerase III delta prime subunit
LIYAGRVLRELVTRPISAVVALIDLPRTIDRSMREANELMEISREQLELMRRQADEALIQAERMNDLLARVVKLTEPLEKAQRSGEYVGERLKRAIFGEDELAVEGAAERAEAAVLKAEAAAEEAEEAVEEAEESEGAGEDVPGR